MSGHTMEKSPWERGHADGLKGQPAPRFPTPDSSWAERLYAAGWNRGADKRDAIAKATGGDQ